MSHSLQQLDQIINDLDQAVLNMNPHNFSEYMQFLEKPEVLMQKLIKAHDRQIITAIIRHDQKISKKN